MEQRTEEWYAARAGRVTASRIKDVMAKETTAAYQNYLAELALETVIGPHRDMYVSPAMQHGIDTEPQARAFYELETLTRVEEVGFIQHPTMMAGASPDGLVGEDGLIEIKCPQPAQHFRTLEGDRIKREYILQMQWQMECTERAWCDFVSFHPDFPDHCKVHIERVTFDLGLVEKIREAVKEFTLLAQKKADLLREKAA